MTPQDTAGPEGHTPWIAVYDDKVGWGPALVPVGAPAPIDPTLAPMGRAFLCLSREPDRRGAGVVRAALIELLAPAPGEPSVRMVAVPDQEPRTSTGRPLPVHGAPAFAAGEDLEVCVTTAPDPRAGGRPSHTTHVRAPGTAAWRHAGVFRPARDPEPGTRTSTGSGMGMRTATGTGTGTDQGFGTASGAIPTLAPPCLVAHEGRIHLLAADGPEVTHHVLAPHATIGRAAGHRDEPPAAAWAPADPGPALPWPHPPVRRLAACSHRGEIHAVITLRADARRGVPAGRILHTVFDGSAWSPARPLRGARSGDGCALASHGDRLHVVYPNADGAGLVHQIGSGRGWTMPVTLPLPAGSGTPALASGPAGDPGAGAPLVLVHRGRAPSRAAPELPPARLPSTGQLVGGERTRHSPGRTLRVRHRLTATVLPAGGVVPVATVLAVLHAGTDVYARDRWRGVPGTVAGEFTLWHVEQGPRGGRLLPVTGSERAVRSGRDAEPATVRTVWTGLSHGEYEVRFHGHALGRESDSWRRKDLDRATAEVDPTPLRITV
ncbi:hypothetical protein ACN20G_34375 (plasmid) [Streptomyces sp. BI20]|uniref:hypothetical protein n=1 Tax=Streptomyces sp. BI20 TaxID=3403460 RepID=UPI003C75FDC4